MVNQNLIYLVDDDDDDRLILREAVESQMEQVEIVEFTNGYDFIKKMENPTLPEGTVLVLMDLNMPRMSGLEVLTQLNTMPVGPQLPVLVLSTAASPDIIQKVIEVGAVKYCVKPSSMAGIEQLAKEIKEFFQFSL
ncbi:response regulator receiver domain-containing protein [Dyadobacter jejuensis]|uniref:Response regulator receiver domain-containing protein n=1 Tax=Dyadobacter jejuensis TaxID=1082580 RepID=A0A316AN11_9BACT|nr:response regulator [Dyadobacter jejuensis]PWJ58699.1 response regulator receiver domain-containing protein [Dyadobacter jejuensis]